MNINILLWFVYLLTWGINALCILREPLMSFLNASRVSRFFLIGSVCIPIVFELAQSNELIRPSPQIWSGSISNPITIHSVLTSADPALLNHSEAAAYSTWFNLSFLTITYYSLIAGIALTLCIYLFRNYKLIQFIQVQPVIKKIGKTYVLTSDEIDSPFSFWFLNKAYVMIPTSYLIQRSDYSIVMHHEIQHHRQGDTQWAHVLALLKAVFFWNPAIYLFSKICSQFQEFACDEFLIGRRNISPHAYGSCLLQAAESAMSARSILFGTTGMATSAHRSILKRRIEIMLQAKTPRLKRWPTVLLVSSAVVFMATLSFASKNVVGSNQITLAEAQIMAEQASKGSEIPLSVNELVLEKLNHYIGTSEGRKFLQDAFFRMQHYKKMIDGKITEYGLPKELIAVALYESGFRNDYISPSPARAAGIWQFIASTARKYDLVVNDAIDERLNPEKETHAAMRYFQDLFLLLQDWRLALKAYNEGENYVFGLIRKHGTRDPWELEKKDSREGYLPGVIAMMIILKNPSLIQ